MSALNTQQFEQLLATLCRQLTSECGDGTTFDKSATFENRVREVLQGLLGGTGIEINFEPHPYVFPDIVLGEYGIEVKFTTNDTWRSVANSVFESFRSEEVKHIYLVFGKMGGNPEVQWGKYEDCVIHVRTSHVPRFEVELPQEGGSQRESLFTKFGISYNDFCHLPIHARMEHVRKYARGRLKQGERLWWLDDRPEQGHSLELEVRLFAHLTNEEKLKLRAEMSLLCPQIVKSGADRRKYSDAYMYALTYRGVLCGRDAFSAGSAAGPERGGVYVQKALKRIENEMKAAANYLEDALFVEYWGVSVPPGKRITEWLKRADELATTWKPSDVLFLKKRSRH